MQEEEVAADIFFRTNRCVCRSMTREDVYERCEWGPYDSILLSYYAFSIESERAKKALYNRWIQMKRFWYAIDMVENGELIAILSLRKIRKLIKSARLGLVIKPEYINQGYGTEIIKGFMKYYFEIMGYRSLCLDAAEFNKRALRCYTKCGFKQCGEFEREYAGRFEVIGTNEYREHNHEYTKRGLKTS